MTTYRKLTPGQTIRYRAGNALRTAKLVRHEGPHPSNSRLIILTVQGEHGEIKLYVKPRAHADVI